MRVGNDDINTAIMAVGAHADDIEIGAGGTIEKYFRVGYEVVYVMSTNNMSGSVHSLDADGNSVYADEANSEMMARRKRECDDAAREWNTTPIHLDYPQRHYLDENLKKFSLRYGAPVPSSVQEDVPSIILACEEKEPIARMRDLILEKNPEIILTHPLATYNPEHWGTTMLVCNAYWEAVKMGYQGAVLQWLEPQTRFGAFYNRWETFVDYSPYLDRKMELIGKHACQMPKAHLSNFGPRILAQEYGKACGCLAAECFIWTQRTSHKEKQHGFPVYSGLMLELLKNSR